MKFLLRSILTLSVAVGLGICLYYAVQALPGNGSDGQPSRPGVAATEANDSESENQSLASAPDLGEIFRGFRWWTLRKVAGKVLIFSVITAVVVIVHKMVSRKRWSLRI